jgi:lysozyme family protein
LDVQQRIETLADAAAALGADASQIRGLAQEIPDYGTALPVLSDFRDGLGSTSAAANLQAEADAIIGLLQLEERGPPPELQEGGDVLPRATFDDLKADYLRLFESCVVRLEYVGQVAWHVQKLKEGRANYERVGTLAKIPWYFIGIVHGLEASFRFSGHLHNGDPLSARTVHVPAGRPQVWNPPNDWNSSAIDALTVEGFTGKSDWGLARELYRWEAYNGFGSRARGINTPYLWSFSTHYERGKFKSDGHWDPNLVSRQCGAAVMLHALIDAGQVDPAPES